MKCLLSYSEVPLSKLSSNYKTAQTQLQEQRMTNQHPKLWKYGFKTVEVDFKDIPKYVKSNYRCYSAGDFTDGEAKNNSWIQGKQNLIIFDVDEALTLEEAKNLFCDHKAILITSRSHQIEKNGATVDRFRVIMPTKAPITCDVKTYSETMAFMTCHKYKFIDKQCKDPARIYFGFTDENTEVHFTDSEALFDFDSWTEKMHKQSEIASWCNNKIEEQTKLTIVEKIEYTNEGTKADWYRANWKTSKILEAIKFNEKFYKGGRNGTLYSWTKYLLEDVGLTDSETAELILWINGQGDGIAESEIQQTIFRSLRMSA